MDHAVDHGHAKVDAIELSDDQLVQTLLRNRRVGSPLLEGVKVYRGSKDPDVDSGTFDPAFKHGTVSVSTALGYAMTANSHIGLNSKLTHGFGMVAEYALPTEAVFFRNFGVEDREAIEKLGMNVRQAEELLTPYVDQCLHASTPEEQTVAVRALTRAAAVSLYEIPIPVEQEPDRRWIVQYNDVSHRLIEYEEKGPGAEVLIDIVRARKCIVDAHRVEPFINYAAATASSENKQQFEAFSPGLVAACSHVAGELTKNMEQLQREAFNEPLMSVSDAIAWRRHEQRDIRLAMLSNSGFSIDHVRPELAAVDVLEPALRSVERAILVAQKADKLSQLKTTVEAAVQISGKADDLVRSVNQIAAEQDRVKKSFNEIRELRDVVDGALTEAYVQHEQRQGNPVRRVLYRFNGRKEALANMATLQNRQAEAEATLRDSSQTLRALQVEHTTGSETLHLLRRDLALYGAEIAATANEGSLGFLSQYSVAQGVPNTAAWERLAHACEKEMTMLGAELASGRAHSEVFKAIAKQGVSTPVAETIVGIDERWISSAVELSATRNGLQLSGGLSSRNFSNSLQDGKLIGRVAYVDKVIDVAILDVGRGMAKAIPLSSLPARVSEGTNVKLQVHGGVIKADDRRALTNSTARGHER